MIGVVAIGAYVISFLMIERWGPDWLKGYQPIVELYRPCTWASVVPGTSQRITLIEGAWRSATDLKESGPLTELLFIRRSGLLSLSLSMADDGASSKSETLRAIASGTPEHIGTKTGYLFHIIDRDRLHIRPPGTATFYAFVRSAEKARPRSAGGGALPVSEH